MLLDTLRFVQTYSEIYASVPVEDGKQPAIIRYAIRGFISKPQISQTIRVIAIVGNLKQNSDISKKKRLVR